VRWATRAGSTSTGVAALALTNPREPAGRVVAAAALAGAMAACSTSSSCDDESRDPHKGDRPPDDIAAGSGPDNEPAQSAGQGDGR